jgi:probable selenium-dependent hydroxylase accessory protein YqeC
LRGLPRAPGIVALFSHFDASEGKVIGCEPDEIDELKALAVADVILVEADGARHCAIKAPAAHEPCIPRSSNTVIALTGARPWVARPIRPTFIAGRYLLPLPGFALATQLTRPPWAA